MINEYSIFSLWYPCCSLEVICGFQVNFLSRTTPRYFILGDQGILLPYKFKLPGVFGRRLEKSTAVLLWGFNIIFHLSPYFWISFRWAWIFWVIVSVSLALEYIALSSAYSATSVLFVVGKSKTYKLKSKGEIFEPCGTPALICFVLDVVSLIRTLKQRSER